MSDLVNIIWQPIFILIGIAVWAGIGFWLWVLALSLRDMWRGRTVRR